MFSFGPGAGRPSYENPFTPVVPFQGAVERESHTLHSRYRCESLFKLLIECGQLFRSVAGARRIQVNHVPVVSLEAKVLVLHVAQTLGQQAGAHQQHDRQRCLNDDEGLLGERRSGRGWCG